jgi:hypothetical protein
LERKAGPSAPKSVVASAFDALAWQRFGVTSVTVAGTVDAAVRVSPPSAGDSHGLSAGARKPRIAYSIRRPLIARAITSCWICSVPSKMS